MTRQFGVGIIGCGGISVTHLRNYKRYPEECEVIAVADMVEDRARQHAHEYNIGTIYSDYHDLLADDRVDVVSICLPNFLHAPVSIAAMKAGKHVLCEKPMAMNIGECLEMIEVARQTGAKLAIVSECINPRHRFIKEHVIPEIGDIQFSFLCDFYFRDQTYYASGSWRGTWRYEGGGILVNQAIYTWDQLAWFNSGIEAAYGYWTNILHPAIEVEDIGYGLVEFRNGSFGKVFATTACRAPDGNIWGKIIGTEGEIYSTEPWFYVPDFSLKDKDAEAKLKKEMPAGLKAQPNVTSHTAQIPDLFAAIREDRSPMISGDTAKEALKILNGIHWHGWQYQEDFRKWVVVHDDLPRSAQPDQPPTADDAGKQDWRGGKPIETLCSFTTTPARELPAPFVRIRHAQ